MYGQEHVRGSKEESVVYHFIYSILSYYKAQETKVTRARIAVISKVRSSACG